MGGIHSTSGLLVFSSLGKLGATSESITLEEGLLRKRVSNWNWPIFGSLA